MDMDMNECDKVGLSLWFSVKNAEHKIQGGNPKSDSSNIIGKGEVGY